MQSLSFKFFGCLPFDYSKYYFSFIHKWYWGYFIVEKEEKSEQNNNFMTKWLSLGSSLNNAHKENWILDVYFVHENKTKNPSR